MTILGFCVAFIATGIAILFSLYQRRNTQARALNEPPLLPYSIPFVGHALWYGRRSSEVYAAARTFSPDSRPVSITLMGQRVYIVTANKDVSAVYRAKSLSFNNLVLWGLGAVFNISREGRDVIAYEPGHHSSLLENSHVFYRDALREGSALNEFTASFLDCLRKELDKEDAKIDVSPKGMKVQLRDWARTILGTASTIATMGPQILEEEPNLLKYNWQFDLDIVSFTIGLPRFLIKRQYANREKLIRAFEKVYRDRETKQQDAIWWIPERQRMLAEAGMTSDYDIGASTLPVWNGLQTNSNPTAFWLLLHIVAIPGLADRIRKSIAPAFDSEGKVTNVDLMVNDPLLRSAYNEILRLYSGSVSTRVVTEDTIISGYNFRKGGVVMCPARPHHWDVDVWGPDVEEFVPDRFIRESTNSLIKGDAKLTRPFGGGTSLCPGRFFASNEIISFVGAILLKYDIRLAAGETVPRPNVNTPSLGFSAPLNDVEVIITKRSKY
ncbi:cytochrome P450 [Guyanagaster necrorhizus]|uniref:Cytochrome P450 n=1 Tax=Guyanagaster necrorhizus TaxID=856835 RepID=A0A9P8AX94_9AGAR|nr:cytochrome P450 [Guyanagaster necrorhizus MCA 3950]KAG7449707.1 cytochrome P450 [Guyanagaster necrorhizus MCA 3950]